MGKRIFLFLLTNLAVVLTLSVVLSVLGVGSYVGPDGLNLGSARHLLPRLGHGRRVHLAADVALDGQARHRRAARRRPHRRRARPTGCTQTVERLTRQANLPMPEVGIYESPEVNAFATGPSKSRSLVAVSSGCCAAMRRNEVEGVLAHEVAHIANGDMVTMTLLQGVMNAFVMFFARMIAFCGARSRATRGNSGGAQLHGGDRAGDRARHPRLAGHRVVLAAARVPRRLRRRHAGRPRQHARRAAAARRQPRAGRPEPPGAGDDEDQRRAGAGWCSSPRTRRSSSGSRRCSRRPPQ